MGVLVGFGGSVGLLVSVGGILVLVGMIAISAGGGVWVG